MMNGKIVASEDNEKTAAAPSNWSVVGKVWVTTDGGRGFLEAEVVELKTGNVIQKAGAAAHVYGPSDAQITANSLTLIVPPGYGYRVSYKETNPGTDFTVGRIDF